MAKVNWLIEKDVFEENIERFRETILKQGMSLYECENDFSSNYNIFPEKSCVVFYGSLNLMRRLFHTKNWVPGGWCNLDNFKCSTYYSYFSDYLLNSDYVFLPLNEFIRQKDFIFSIFGNEIFVRPDSGYKEFTGKVIFSKEKIDLNTFDIGFYYDNSNIMILISSVKKVLREWRFVVTEKEIVTGTCYKVDKELGVDEGNYENAFNFAQKIISEVKWMPDPIYTLDVCERDNGRLYVLEINGFSTSGLYDCDIEKIVKVASELAIKEYDELVGEIV